MVPLIGALADRAFLRLAFRRGSASSQAARDLFAHDRAEVARLYADAEADGRLYAPPRPARWIEEPQSGLPDGEVVDLRWPSAWRPLHRRYHELQERVPRNLVVHARWYRHHRPAHAVVCLHGYAGGLFPLEALVFRAGWLYRRGFDVVLANLPFHGRRAPLRPGLPLFPSADPALANEGCAQMASDLRALVFALTARGAPRVSVCGVSLGGFAAALLATVEPTLDTVVAMMPFGSLPEQLWHFGEGTEARRRAEAARRGVDDFAAPFRAVTPLLRQPLVRREKILLVAGAHDRVVPPAATEKLRAHFASSLGGPVALHTFAGAHLVPGPRGRIFEAVLEHLRRS